MNYRGILFGLLGVGVVAAVVTVAGAYNVAASAGHLPPVKALLHLTMRNSVRIRSGTAAPQDLGAEARVRAGAGHYDLVCRDCHGAPDEPVDAVARHMVPAPPHIVDAVQSWSAEDLFWIVKHGIKMSAMPAWPAPARDDEVWSMVAFLQGLPDMSVAEYRRLTLGPLALEDGDGPGGAHEADVHLQRCARCHGYDGGGMQAHGVPRIGGLTVEYLRDTLLAYAAGRRASGIMQAQATAVPRERLDDLARHYAEAPGPARPQLPDPAQQAVETDPDPSLGERLAREGAAERLVPACAQCHGPATHRRAAAYPALAGQPVEYLETQLRLFREGRRGGGEFAQIMNFAASELEDRDIRALARYYADLDPGEAASAALSGASAPR